MKLASLALLAGSAAAFAPAQTGRASTQMAESAADLEALAKGLNLCGRLLRPASGLSEQNLWGTTSEGDHWLHPLRPRSSTGRIAMFAFVGYIATANGWHWALGNDFGRYPRSPQGVSPPEAWDAIPDAAKLQIIGFVGFLEFVR